jgi:hypothetical protein
MFGFVLGAGDEHDRPVTLVTLSSAAQRRRRGSRSVTNDHL